MSSRRKTVTTILFAVAFVLVPQLASAQPNTFPGSGNAGAGTDTPTYKLQVSGNGGTVGESLLVTDSNTTTTAIDLANTSSGAKKWRLQSVGSSISGRIGNFEFVELGSNLKALVIQPSGNVGIGTLNPAVKLHSQLSSPNTGTPTGSDMGMFINNSDTTANNYALIGFGNAFPQFQAAIGSINLSSGANAGGHLVFHTRPAAGGTAERMRIDSSGRVGIGTTAPGALFTVSSNAATLPANSGSLARFIAAEGVQPIVSIEGFAIHGGLVLRRANTTATNPSAVLADNLLGAISASGYGTTGFSSSRGRIAFAASENWTDTAQGSYITFNTTANGAATVAGTERMRIDNAGNVGIGTASPASLLDLKGSNVPYIGQLRIAANDYGQITFYDSANLAPNATNRKSWLYHDLAAGTFNFASNGNILFHPNNFFGIGTTSPAYRLDVQGGLINSSGGLCIAGDCKTAWSQVGGSGADSQWTTAGTSIYYNNGVGIGTQSPGYMLDVQSNAQWAARFKKTDATNGGVLIESAAGYNPNLALSVNGTIKWYLNSNVAQSDSLQFWESTGGTPRFTLTQAGNVGIGNSSPTEKLHVTGNGKFTGNVTVDGTINAKYQDVAEWVPSSEQLAAGTVVVLDTSKSNQVISSATAYDTRVAGVISAQPGITLGEGGEGKVLVATTGRVRVKVDASRGAIQIGDLLVTSEAPGVAMKSEAVNLGGVQIHRPGTIIGKALEPIAGRKGEILVLLSLQ